MNDTYLNLNTISLASEGSQRKVVDSRWIHVPRSLPSIMVLAVGIASVTIKVTDTKTK